MASSNVIDVCSSEDEDEELKPVAAASGPSSMNSMLSDLRRQREARDRKRPRTDSSSAAARPAKQPVATPNDYLFIFAPGAGGRGPCPIMLQQVTARGRISVRAVDAPGWGTKGSPSSNAAKVEAAIVASSPPTPGTSIILVGHSYGCRVLVEFLRKHYKSAGLLGDAARRGAILLGYPLYATRGTTDRVTPLQTLPADAPPLTFVSGRKDEFIKKREACLREVIERMACRASAKVVFTNGSHGVEDGTPTALEAVRAHVGAA